MQFERRVRVLVASDESVSRASRNETLPRFHGHRGITEVHDHVEFPQGSITDDRPECVVQVDHPERQRCIPPLNLHRQPAGANN